MPIITTAIAFISGLFTDTAVDFVKDELKESIHKRLDIIRSTLSKKEIPLNNDIPKAIRKCFLLAGLEVARWGRRQWNFEVGINEEAYWEADATYRLIIDYLDTELARLNHKDYKLEESILIKHSSLTFTRLIDEYSQIKEQHIQEEILNELITEITVYLHKLPFPHDLPDEFRHAVNYGWTDKAHSWTVFNLMCDFFLDYMKTDEQLRSVIQTQWLNNIKDNTDHLTALLTDLGNDFISTYGKIPTYFNEILVKLNPQPQLRFDYRGGDYPRFTFRSRYVPFMGRENEMKLLHEFCNDPNLFSWCLITGPGGSGKSRLALELCTEIANSQTFYTGFIKNELITSFNWATWQPTCSTLIVIDYVALAYEPVLKLLRALNDRAETKALSFPVKILLLERDTSDTWFEQFKRQIRTKQIPELFNNEPIKLPRLDVDFLWSIIKFIVIDNNRPLPYPFQIIPKLLEIDALGRPLFAVFVGYALAEGAEMTEWDKVQLLQYLLDRHIENIWLPGAANDSLKLHQHLNLLVIATMTGGLSQEQVDQLLDKNYKWLPDDNLDLGLYRLISPSITDNYQYAPLDPDIFGEYFVLWQLNRVGSFPRLEKGKTLNTRKEVWKLNSDQANQFTYRLFQDFAHFSYRIQENSSVNLMALEFFIKNLFEDYNTNTELFKRANLLFMLISNLGKRQLISQAQAIYNELRQIALLHPINEIIYEQTKAAVNLLITYTRSESEDKSFTEPLELYKELQQLATKFPSDDLTVAVVRAAATLSNEFSKIHNFDKALELYNEIKLFAHDRSLSDVLILQADSIVNLINDLSETSQFIKAQDLNNQLKVLCLDNPLDEIVISQADAFYALIYHLNRKHNANSSKKIYNELRLFSESNPLEKVLINQANAIVDLIYYLNNNQDSLIFSQELYEQLRLIIQKNPLDKLKILYSDAALALINKLNKTGDIAISQIIYNELKGTSIERPFIKIVVNKANAASRLIEELSKSSNFTLAYKLYKDLKELASGKVFEVAKNFETEAIFTKVFSQKEFDPLHDLFQELEKLNDNTPLNQIRIFQAVSLYSLIRYLGEAKIFNQAQNLYMELRDLSAHEPLEEILDIQSKSAFKLSSDLSNANKFREAHELINELRQLSNDNNTLDKIRINRSYALYDFIHVLSSSNQFDKAIELFNELKHLSSEKPLNEIKVSQARAAYKISNSLRNNRRFDKLLEFYNSEIWSLVDNTQSSPVLLEVCKLIGLTLVFVGNRLLISTRHRSERIFLELIQTYRQDKLWKEDSNYLRLLTIEQLIKNALGR